METILLCIISAVIGYWIGKVRTARKAVQMAIDVCNWD